MNNYLFNMSSNFVRECGTKRGIKGECIHFHLSCNFNNGKCRFSNNFAFFACSTNLVNLVALFLLINHYRCNILCRVNVPSAEPTHNNWFYFSIIFISMENCRPLESQLLCKPCKHNVKNLHSPELTQRVLLISIFSII